MECELEHERAMQPATASAQTTFLSLTHATPAALSTQASHVCVHTPSSESSFCCCCLSCCCLSCCCLNCCLSCCCCCCYQVTASFLSHNICVLVCDTCVCTDGAYPAWQPTCERQTRERPETCEASCGGVCFGRINTTQVLVNGGCEQLCEDSSGNIVCGCTAGFRLTADNTTCEEFNPCDENNGGCSDTCVPGALDQFECTCPSGFEALDGFNCEDVDECLVSNGGTHDSVCTRMGERCIKERESVCV